MLSWHKRKKHNLVSKHTFEGHTVPTLNFVQQNTIREFSDNNMQGYHVGDLFRLEENLPNASMV